MAHSLWDSSFLYMFDTVGIRDAKPLCSVTEKNQPHEINTLTNDHAEGAIPDFLKYRYWTKCSVVQFHQSTLYL